MPKLTKDQKKALMKKVEKAFDVIGKEFPKEEKERILADTERDRVHELGEKYVNFRNDAEQYMRDNYSDIEFEGFKRIAPLYLDMSGTPEADQKNRALLTSLTTEEGRKEFTDQVTKDILNLDMRHMCVTGDVEKDTKTYAAHAREIELCWVVDDLVGDGAEYLDSKIKGALKDRKLMYQSVGDFASQVRIAASDLYTVMPELTLDETNKIDDAQVPLSPGSLYATKLDNAFLDQLSDYNSDVQIRLMHEGDEMGKVMKKAVEMEKNGQLTPFTIAKNENGEQVRLTDGITASLKGEKITFVDNETDRDMIASFISKASRPIQMPKEKDTSNYDSFSAEALSAQGKGLLEEYARLNKIMDGAKLWYTDGSFEFHETARLLKKFAAGEIPNKDQAIEQMDQILKQCDKYIDDKNKVNRELKPREQKRLDAMTAVRDSIKSRRAFLSITVDRGGNRHWEAAEGAGLMTEPFHVSNENQYDYYVAESDRKAAQYRREIISYMGKGAAMNKLIPDVEATVVKLGNDSVNDKPRTNEKKNELEDTLPKELAKLALVEIMREDRMQAKKNNANPEKGQLEVMLDKMAEDKNAWSNIINKLREIDTVKKLAADITKSSAASADFFMNRGPQKLAADIKKEMKELVAAVENKAKNKAKGKEKSKSNKKAASIGLH